MGNSSSSGRGHHDESVDYGALVPQGVYTGPRDYNQAIVSQLIAHRRLAPFYRPLEDYDDSWDDDQILAARKELPSPEDGDSVTRIEATAPAPSHSGSKSKRPGALKEPAKPEAQVYRGAVECPICFLYYPPNINHSRCCDQAICTECFVQIKRAEPTTTHLVSEYAACPYCVQENFGVVYTPPTWRAGLGSEGSNALWSDSQRVTSEPTTMPMHKRRQKSFGADSPEVVTTDQIRPDWEAKLEAVRAAVARRANRRIIMRQVGDRLIPVGVTSGRVHPLSPEEAAAAGADTSGGRRSRRRGGPQASGGALEQFMGMGGQDLEELMLMEAMRLSMIDHEEHQKKEADEKKKKEAAEAIASRKSAESSMPGGPFPGGDGPGPSTLDSRSSLQASSANLSTTSLGSSQGKHSKVDSQDSTTPGRKSWSISRSRTPPPPPNPASNVPQSEENQVAWRNRAAGPPAFSTLSAALTSTSTAAAVLGAPRTATPEPAAAAAPVAAPDNANSSLPPSSSAASHPVSDPTPSQDLSIPIITVVNNDTGSVTSLGHAGPSASSGSDDTTHTAATTATSTSTASSSPPLPPTPGEPSSAAKSSPLSDVNGMPSTPDDSSVSTVSASSEYGNLPSSPESAAEPLLHPSASSVTKVGSNGAAEAGIPELSR